MDPSQQIRAVTFDVGGTLIEPWPSVGHVYAGVAARFGIAAGAAALNRAFAAAWKARPALDYSREGWQALVNDTFASAGAPHPSGECFAAIYRRFAGASAWRVFDDVVPTLTTLAGRGVALGVISNWDERLRPLLEALNLARRFRTIVVSCEAGHAKPAREIFLRAAAELGCEPGAILHVGDGAREDTAGARAAGLRALRIRRDSPPAAENELSSLAALPESLEAAGTGRLTD